MKTKLHTLCGCWLAVATATITSAAVPMDGVQAALERWAGDRPGAVIALAIDGDERGLAQAGRWSASDDRLADEHTAFEIGSITKVFTSLLGAQAAQDGVWDWNAPIGADFAASPITGAMLATHTSGLPALPVDFPAQSLSDPYRTLGLDELRAGYAATLEATDLPELPAKWSYSNLGVAVLGQAIAASLGGDYERLLAERVLEPLGLSETWMSTPASPTPDTMAPAFTPDGATSRWHFEAYAPAGALVSTAADLERFARAMLRPDAPVGATMEPHAETGQGDAMGYGWFVREVKGEPVYWHGGGTGGYRSFVGVQPATGRAMVVLGARDQDVSGIGIGWFQGLLEASDAADAAEIDAAVYVGDYPLAPSMVLRVFEENGALRVQATSQPVLTLVAQGENQFAIDGVPARVVFNRDEDGAVTGLVLHQGGREMPAPWHEAGSVDSDRKGVQLTVAQLEGLEGDYALSPAITITVSRSGTQLHVRLTGQPTLPIYASAPDEFFYDVVDAQISFERDASGAVTGLVLHQNGRDMPAKKR